MSDEVAGVGRPLLHPVPSWEEEIRTQTGAEGRRWVRSRQGWSDGLLAEGRRWVSSRQGWSDGLLAEGRRWVSSRQGWSDGLLAEGRAGPPAAGRVTSWAARGQTPVVLHHSVVVFVTAAPGNQYRT